MPATAGQCERGHIGDDELHHHYGAAAIRPAFDLTENPISEGGAWSSIASPWKKVRTTGGIACPAAYTDIYDDAYAILSGFPPNVEVEATIYMNGPGHEVEILLRVLIPPRLVRGYECLLQR